MWCRTIPTQEAFFAPFSPGMFDWLKFAKRLKEHDELLEQLTRLVKSRDLDWEDMRARCKRLLDRTEKAARTVVQSEEHSPGEELVEDGNASTPASSGRLLTPRQMQLQQIVLKRRMNQ